MAFEHVLTVRVTVSPAMMGEEEEEVREIVAGSVEEMHCILHETLHTAVDTYHNSLCFSLIAGERWLHTIHIHSNHMPWGGGGGV